MSNKGTCKAQDCGKDVRGKGYCERHFNLWKKGKMGKPRYNTCNHEECRKPRANRGLCQEHFDKQYNKKAEAAAA